MANFFLEVDFYIALAAALAIDLVARRANRALRVAVLLLVSGGMLALLKDAGHLLPMVAVYAVVVVAVALLLRRLGKTPAARAISMLTVAAIVIVLLTTRHPVYLEVVVGWHASLMRVGGMPWLGVSYLTFRAVDLVLAARSGSVKQIRPLDALLYLLFFVPFTSGPIVRFRTFAADLDVAPPRLVFEDLRAVLERVAVGVIKMLLLSKLAFAASVLAPDFLEGGLTPLRLTVGLYAFYAYIYLEFSGYCDCAIAIGRLFGVRVPENFNWPFLATSVQDFWNRWHISLSHWCRDHLFFPMMMALSTRSSDLPRIVWLCVSIFFTFALVGMWHGDALHWFLYGCLHGAGLALTAVYDHVMRARAPRLIEQLRERRAYRAVCAVATFHFVAFGLMLAIPEQHADALWTAAFG